MEESCSESESQQSEQKQSEKEPEQGQKVSSPAKTETDLHLSPFRSASVDHMDVSDATESVSLNDNDEKKSYMENLIGIS